MPPDPHQSQSTSTRACPRCLARSALLALLSARIAYAAADPSRLLDLLGLPEEQLIAAIGGRRRKELGQRHRDLLSEPQADLPGGIDAICRHDRWHQAIFGDLPASPVALYVHDPSGQIQATLRQPVVALVGSHRASDYGMEMAASLARALAASGVSVISGFAPGVPAAVHLGVLEAGGRPLMVLPGGIDVCSPSGLLGLRRRALERGSTLAEMPPGFRARRWSEWASERILAAIAAIVVVVESGRHGEGMTAARLAAKRGIGVGAMPGRVTSPCSRGPHALLRAGATLIACPEDALDLLYRGEKVQTESHDSMLDANQLDLIERVGAGEDTLERLVQGPEAERMLTALSQLRCNGLIARGDGGRYLPSVSLDGPFPYRLHPKTAPHTAGAPPSKKH